MRSATSSASVPASFDTALSATTATRSAYRAEAAGLKNRLWIRRCRTCSGPFWAIIMDSIGGAP